MFDNDDGASGAGVIENLSNDIAEVIYDTKDGKWIVGNAKHNKKKKKRGFNRFIKEKTGCQLR
jgi:hypothetical protein